MKHDGRVLMEEPDLMEECLGSIPTPTKYSDSNMNEIEEDLKNLQNITEMRKILDDLVDAHEQLADEKWIIQVMKQALNFVADATANWVEKFSESMENGTGEDEFNQTRKCMDFMLKVGNILTNASTEIIVDLFEIKLFDNLLSVEIKRMILEDEVQDFLKARDDTEGTKDSLTRIAKKLILEIRNAYEFLRHEFLLINDWKEGIEQVEPRMTLADDSSCNATVFRYAMASIPMNFSVTNFS